MIAPMASWIVHLRIAELLLAQIEGLESASFAVGNIAPDSGIPDEKWENFTPPPEVTHFKTEHSFYRTGDLLFLRQHFDPACSGGLDGAAFSFRLGYFCHLVTDNLWSVDVYRPTRERCKAEFEANPDFIWEVKKDWYGLDHRFVRENPDSLFWRVFLGCEYARGELDFLPLEAVQARIRHIQDYYRSDDAEVREMLDRPFAYLSKDEMDGFVRRSAQRFLRIYRRLWLEGEGLPEGGSLLETVA